MNRPIHEQEKQDVALIIFQLEKTYKNGIFWLT